MVSFFALSLRRLFGITVCTSSEFIEHGVCGANCLECASQDEFEFLGDRVITAELSDKLEMERGKKKSANGRGGGGGTLAEATIEREMKSRA